MGIDNWEVMSWPEIGKAIGRKLIITIGRYNTERFSPKAHMEYLRLQMELGMPNISTEPQNPAAEPVYGEEHD